MTSKNPGAIKIKRAQSLTSLKQDKEVNKSAEAFIQKFRRQLLLQRLQSIENSHQMLEKGL
ncbi:hypothetical protein ES332_A09G103600v1 [Gossypium tomentosum]|uniref:Uncharacterized protein n=1 Tax=Gossypium tomentosum TaxID=34277 RepID=A0A5D2P2C8_GOSTO|nr:hypothetical protein ES332_A09G103600v1 [Gossypium tomentosum]